MSLRDLHDLIALLSHHHSRRGRYLGRQAALASRRISTPVTPPGMLGYISSTRKKSCYACVKAKRRCTLGYPFCRRCFVRGLDCGYPNAQRASVRDAEVIIRQTTPDIVGSSSAPIVDLGTNVDAHLDPPLLFHSASSSDDSDTRQNHEGPVFDFDNNDWNNNRSNWRRDEPTVRYGPSAEGLRIGRTLLPEIWAPAQLNDGQVRTVIRGLRSIVPDMASGSTHFIHQNLYQHHEPESYQDCVALSALYVLKNPRTHSTLASSINTKIGHLITSSHTWTLEQHLAAVQALILYQIMRLFDPDPVLQAHGEKHNALLELWSAHLWKRFFNETPHFADRHASFVFNESLRRTVLMSVFTRCGWSIMTRGGIADEVPVLARLPITRDLEAWRCEPERWEGRVVPWLSETEGLVSYGGWSTAWSSEREIEGLDPFGKLLLAACRGRDDPRLLV